MSQLARSLLWVMAMVLIALSSRFGLISDEAGNIMLMAALGGWVATTPSSGRCRLWSAKP